MANNLKVFNNYNDYETADLIKPAVSLVVSDNSVHYDPASPTPPPTFDGKWKATYSNENVTSAECDSSSAITQNEINLSNLVSVEIGDCVTSIDYAAFSRCSGLTSVTIGSGVTTIGDGAFNECSSLTSCTIGSGVTSIGSTAFRFCSSLTSIDIPNSVTSIGDGAFNECSSLTSCTIGSGVTSIGNWAFENCSSLTSVTVNATTPPTLGSAAFNYTNDCPIYVGCESLEAYKSADVWSDYADRIQCIQPSFEGKFKATYSGGETYEKVCDSSSLITTSVTKPTGYEYTAMTEAIIGNCVSTVAMNAFSGFTSLSSVTISDNVTSLANQVFKDCISLTEVKLPSGINKILDNTFENCTSLKNIDIPSGVTMIGGFENCTSLENITLPNALSEIYGEAFKGCTSLKNISIPNSVTSINDYAFYNCTSLQSITINATTPPTLRSSAFDNTNNCAIYVPANLVNTYKSANNWKTYASRIQAIPNS